MAYVDSDIINSENEPAEIVIGNVTRCFAVWVLLSVVTITACFFIAKVIGDNWPNLTLFILITLSTSISLLLFVSLVMGCVQRLRKRALGWKNSFMYLIAAFAVTTIVASGIIELFSLLVNKGIH